jgi:hypothetical protein
VGPAGVVHHWVIRGIIIISRLWDKRKPLLMTVEKKGYTDERTNRSRFSQAAFLGLNVMHLLKRTWATGAIPIGAPGCPELALNVAST